MGETNGSQDQYGHHRLPLRRLVVVACVLTAALFVPLAWHILHSFRTCQTITERYVSGEVMRDAIYHANAELILGARATVFGEEPQGRSRGATAANLRRLIGEARAMEDVCVGTCWLTLADSLQGAMRDVEAAAIQLAAIGRQNEAVGLLASPAYLAIHESFHAALDQYADQFKAQIQESIDFERGEELGVAGVAGGILLASVAVWVLLVRVLERWRAGMVREAGDRQEAERRLAAALDRFQRLFQNAHDAIYLVDESDGGIVDANDAACAQTGYADRELRTLRFADLDAEPDDEPVWQHLENEGGVVERLQRRRNGTTFPVEVGIRRIEEEAGTMRLCVVRDVTERKAFESQLGKAQKMECVGRLAAGIAHDFGNILLAISGLAMVGRRHLPREHPAASAFSRIETASAQATGVARSLLHFANRPTTQVRAVELRSLVQGALSLFGPSLPAAVELDEGRVEGEPLWVAADPHRLQQALLNLCLNARDAMCDGGRLVVSVSATGDGGQNLARVSVADTGPGIPADVRRRLGEPFFTTKGDELGSGLGLFNVRTIMNECGGGLEIDSAPGAGSTFSLVLPVQEAPTVAVPGSRDPAAGPATVVLAIESELVRGLAAEALRSFGFDVTVVAGAAEFEERVETDGNIDVAVLDGDLPDDGAARCLELLRGSRTAAQVILVTGEQAVPDAEGITTVVKPYTMPELCDTVRQAVGDRCLEGQA